MHHKNESNQPLQDKSDALRKEREEPMQDLESTPGALKNGFASAGFFLREQEGLG